MSGTGSDQSTVGIVHVIAVNGGFAVAAQTGAEAVTVVIIRTVVITDVMRITVAVDHAVVADRGPIPQRHADIEIHPVIILILIFIAVSG